MWYNRDVRSRTETKKASRLSSLTRPNSNSDFYLLGFFVGGGISVGEGVKKYKWGKWGKVGVG